MDITDILKAVVALTALIVSCAIVPIACNKFSAQELTSLLAWVKIAVAAADQLFNTEKGQEKKQFVLDFLAKKGININLPEVDAAIESEVLRLHRQIQEGVSGADSK